MTFPRRPSGREARRVSLGELLRQAALACGERPFLTFADTGETFSYQAFNTLTNRLARGLTALGAERGEYVAVMLNNGIAVTGVSYALKKIAAVEVAINAHARGAALRRMLELTDCRLLITSRRFLSALADAMPPQITRVVMADGGEEEARRLFAGRTILPWDALMSDDTAEAALPAADDETASVLFTSGTTGVSKGCALSHRASVRAGESMIEAFALTEEDCVYSPYPFFHVGSYQYDVLPALMVGGRAVIRDGFSARNFWRDIVRHQVTWFMSLGSVQALLWAAPPCAEEKQHRLRCFWGTPLPIDHDAFEKRFNVRVARGGGYGSTDAGAVALPMWDKPGGGKVLPRYQVMIADERDNPLPAGEVGEILARPNEPAIMLSEYVGMPDKTVQAWRNLWFHTGDLGFLDEDGDLHWVARMTERIRVKGEMISAYEIEEVIFTHPAVEDCAALGAPDENWGEECVHVFAALKPGMRLALAELQEFCRPRMSRFMVPSRLTVLEEMPRTSTGKPAKAELKQRFYPAE